MRFPLVATCALCVALTAPLKAGILSTLHLEPKTVAVFDRYVAQFEANVKTAFEQSGRMWIDGGGSCCMRGGTFGSGKPVVEARENTEIQGGSIHHFSGTIHVDGASIADVRRIMQDYANYPRYFKPDIAKGSGTLEAGSTPADEHFLSKLMIVESTLWMGVAYDSTYDTHYRQLDPHRWESISTAESIKEFRDPKDPGKGYFPEGDDHGFLWRTNTYWFVREVNGGIDLELDSMTLSRPVPAGFGWWGTKRTHDAVEKMVHDMKVAVDALHARY
jgi:hypothetical protein